LINPSIYTNHGVYEEDFFKSRQPHEIRRICDSIGVEMTNDVFQDIWDKAKEVTPSGEVCLSKVILFTQSLLQYMPLERKPFPSQSELKLKQSTPQKIKRIIP